MYIREYVTKNKKTKVKYISHKLVEAYRNSEGKSSQRIIMNLGSLSIPKKRWKELAALLERRIAGQESFLDADPLIAGVADEALQHNHFVHSHKKEKEERKTSSEYTPINLEEVMTTFSRSLGPELVANSVWEKLGFDSMLQECKLSKKEISLAKAVILGRLIQPGSELSTWKWFQNSTALLEMTEVDLEGMGKDAFYEIGDVLLENKEKIETYLYEKEQVEFKLARKIFLYDLTNTYFEGECLKNNDAKRGVSKEKRADCPLVTLALVVDEKGFPVFCQIYKGNQSEPATLKDVIKRLEADSIGFMAQEKPLLLMDRGIATKDNIDLIAGKGYRYTVIRRKSFEEEYLEEFNSLKQSMDKEMLPPDWETTGKDGAVYLKKVVTEEQCLVLCASKGRIIKEQKMDELKETRFLEDIEKLNHSFQKGNIVVPLKIGERIGRIKNKYPSVGKYYDITIELSEDQNKVNNIQWDKKPLRKQRETLTGCYIIETTQKGLTASEIWNQYMTLEKVEGSFRDLKSELGMHPVMHQKAERTEAHLFIGVLAYHLLISIEHMLREKGDTRCWKTIKAELSSHQRSTMIMNSSDGITYHIRASGIPESNHREIYSLLNVKDPLQRKKRSMVQSL